jgi:hypothetical protein
MHPAGWCCQLTPSTASQSKSYKQALHVLFFVAHCCCVVGCCCRSLWVDSNYAGTIAVGNVTHPFKTLAAAWKTLPVAPKMLAEGVTIYVRPVSCSCNSSLPCQLI